jgi:hypothetical protein
MLPPVRGAEPYALFFPRIGNQVEVRIDGHGQATGPDDRAGRPALA